MNTTAQAIQSGLFTADFANKFPGLAAQQAQLQIFYQEAPVNTNFYGVDTADLFSWGSFGFSASGWDFLGASSDYGDISASIFNTDFVYLSAGDDIDVNFYGVDTSYVSASDDANVVAWGGGSHYVSAGDHASFISYGWSPVDVEVTANTFSVFTGGGNDFVTTHGGDGVVATGGGNDFIQVDSDRFDISTIFGGDGDDFILGGDGNETLLGGAGHDVLVGAGGNDSLFGGRGNDYLYGGDGNDTLYGNGGDDFITAGPGFDVIDGGAGRDTFFFGANDDFNVVLNAEADDQFRFSGSAEDIGNINVTAHQGGFTVNFGDTTVEIMGQVANMQFDSWGDGMLMG